MVNTILPLTLTDVSVRRRGKRLLGPVDVTMRSSGLTMILGPNGSGKTTLLRVMHGVERLSGGKVEWSVGQDEARHRQAYVFQTPIMLRRTVADNLRYPLHLIGIARKEIEAEIVEWLARIGLTPRAGLQATRLSGGEKQKLAIARALIRKPDVLFLDEPCANLDGAATRDIEALLQTALSNGTRIIMTTHDLGQARRLADDAIFMLRGLLHEAGPADAFFNAPQTAELRAFFRGDIIT
ncbi:ATP-binding cassette domain-containing protein [uncultured Roseobacter sp.]|uniref:ATP-binding cassette domain-containing protein n=1 Tax=uncultured Roseobacter sp. TaxID=114847 RepID=UPI0026353645|nr:ATP-binding cassette domain-containing protein [uncultured Roseobacter sp.]